MRLRCAIAVVALLGAGASSCGSDSGDAASNAAGAGGTAGGGAGDGAVEDGGSDASWPGADASDGAAGAAQDAPGDVGSDNDPAEVAPPDPCTGIAPQTDPAANHAAILSCLETVGHAILAPGEFPIPTTIVMPNGSTLGGDATWPRLRLTGGAQAVVSTFEGNEVKFLRLDSDHNLTVPHGGVVMIRGSDSFIHDNHIQCADGAAGDEKDTGVRFSHTDGRNNRVFRNQIHHVHYGVIFDTYPAGAVNTLETNQIFEIRCDAVTFRGYGEAIGNDIRHGGWQCLNPATSPIPGGGFYSLENDVGAKIIDNHVYEVCGMPLDIDRVANFEIRGNTFENPGWNWDGHDHCGAGATAHLIDFRDSVVENNVFRNDGRHTVSSDPNHVMSATGSGVPSDLPSGSSQAVAFALTHRSSSTTWLTTGNAIQDNTFIAGCSAPCVGLGYFVGRGTGFAADGSWSAATTNYFRRNTPFGSNIGSKRCGGNWYAADSTCAAGNLAADCNIDDPQHEGAGHDWARNDDCPHYQ